MSGVRMRSKPEYLPEGTRLRPLRDRIVVKALDFEYSKIIEVAGSRLRTVRGTVAAVGPGAHVRRYDYRRLPDGRREKCAYRDYSARVPMEVKVGDTVDVGYLIIDGADTDYDFKEVYIGAERHFICQQQDVVGIHS